MTSAAGTGHAAAPRLRLATGWYAVGVAMLVVVAVLSLVPLPAVGVGDKTAHVAVYGVLAGYFGLLARRRRALVGVVLGIMAYGALIELAQSLSAYRHGEWGDLLANAAGTLAGVSLHFTPLGRLLLLADSRLAQFLER